MLILTFLKLVLVPSDDPAFVGGTGTTVAPRDEASEDGLNDLSLSRHCRPIAPIDELARLGLTSSAVAGSRGRHREFPRWM